MLGRLKISMKIGMANAILLVLLFGLGGVSVVSLQSTLTKFEDVKLLTQTTNLASDFQSEMIEVEVAVVSYLLGPNENAQNLVLSSIESLRIKITDAKQGQADVEILEMYQTLQTGLVEYEAAFNNVTEKEAARANLIDVDLSSIGANIDTNVFALMDTVSLDGDADLTFMAGESYRNFSAFQLLIKEFLNSNDSEAYKKSLKQLARFEKGFGKLDKQLEVKRHKSFVKKTNRDLKKFITILDKTKVIIAERNQLIEQELKSAAETVGQAVRELKENVLYRQAAISEEAEENVNSATQVSVIVSIVSAAFALLMAYLLARGIATPIVSMTEAMVGLSEGNIEMEVPAKGRGDEIGSMAEAVQVFKDNALRVGELEKQREQERLAAEADKAKVMGDLADDFEGSVGEIVQAVSSRSSEMHEIAKSLAEISQETSGRATAVANSAENVSNDIQTVASAAEELSVSIQEINQQVERSAVISSQAVENAANTSNMVEGLENTAARVSNVVQLINEIAEQTNLLALNATIEAARAGDAGKGFAVVANEVKSLATQTAKATGEISGQITDMQNATTDMVESIKEISDSIEQMNSISSMVAGAVVQQGAATHEIARNVQGVSSGTQDVSSIIAEVSTAASRSGNETEIALSAAEELSGQAERLQTELSRYLTQIRVG